MTEAEETPEQVRGESETCLMEEESGADMMAFLRIDADLSVREANREETPCSKNVMRKQRNWEKRLEAKKSKRKEEKQRRKQNQQEKDEPEFSKRVMKAITRERLEEARTTGPRLCVDLSMTDCMSHKEISRLAAQIRRLYGSNKKSTQPFHIFLTDMKEDGLIYKECVRMNEGFLNYTMDITEESWRDLFPCEDVVYLTPDANEALEHVDEGRIYILGGLVDESIQKKRSYATAKQQAVQTARLPIDEYMVKWPNSKNFHSKILAINQVFDILLMYRDTGSWSKSLSAGVPAGKGYVVSPEVVLDVPPR